VSIDGPRFYYNDYSNESKRFQHKGLNFNLKIIALNRNGFSTGAPILI
jgi:hypothetical protein